MIDRGKFNVLGVPIDAVDYEAAIHRITTAASLSQPMTVSALAVHGVMTGVLDPVHRFRLNRFDLLVPDGQPVRWVLNLQYKAQLPDRVYGPNLMLELCRAAADAGFPIFLYGSTAEVLQSLSTNLTTRFPSLTIAGALPSLFRRLTTEEQDRVAETIRASGARITFVGLGCPRQEIWAYEYRRRLSMPIIAVGAAFPFHAGTLRQAPQLIQDRGLEWLYRLLHEPRRLWKRYLILNPLFCALGAAQLLGLSKRPPKEEIRPAEEMRFG